MVPPVNARGLAFIKAAEGLRLTAYRCSAGRWTIGWGHTGADVHEHMVIPLELAERLFDSDVKRHSEGLARYIRVPVTPNQWAALVSLAFNMGIEAIGGSTLVRLLNDGKPLAAANEFLVWKYVNVSKDPKKRDMREDKGLVKRRREERELFLSGTDLRVA